MGSYLCSKLEIESFEYFKLIAMQFMDEWICIIYSDPEVEPQEH